MQGSFTDANTASASLGAGVRGSDNARPGWRFWRSLRPLLALLLLLAFLEQVEQLSCQAFAPDVHAAFSGKAIGVALQQAGSDSQATAAPDEHCIPFDPRQGSSVQPAAVSASIDKASSPSRTHAEYYGERVHLTSRAAAVPREFQSWLARPEPLPLYLRFSRILA